MKLLTILERFDYGTDDMPPGLTPEQQELWPTLHPRMKNKILTALITKMAKEYADYYNTMADDDNKVLQQDRATSQNSRPESRTLSQHRDINNGT